MKKRFLIVSLFLFFVVIIFIAVKAIKGDFEKELDPLSTEPHQEWTDVYGPLVRTSWKQDAEYSAFTPGNALLGCWSVAFAQVLAFHRFQPSGEVSYKNSDGTAVSVTLQKTEWNKIAGSLDSATPPEISRETAEYCFQVAAVIQKDFGTGDYININAVPCEVTEHYGCQVSKVESEISQVILSEIRSGRPVIVYFDDILSIKLVRNGHAAVIDGIAEEGTNKLIHINFGWGGKSDGWYDYDKLAAERKLKYIFTIREL